MTIARGEVAVDVRRFGAVAATQAAARVPWHSGTTLRMTSRGSPQPEPVLVHAFLGIGYGRPTSDVTQEQSLVRSLSQLVAQTKAQLAHLRSTDLKDLSLMQRESVKALGDDKAVFLAQINNRLAELTPARRIGFPLWLVALLACILPTIWMVRAGHRRGLRRKGLCVDCGYDLRATPERCPECGRSVEPKAGVVA
jgi:hypothetical protein